LLLATYLIMNRDKILKFNSILELGCGVGMPSMLLGELIRKYIKIEDLNCPHKICCTDYDDDVLNNLKNTIRCQFSGYVSPIASHSNTMNTNLMFEVMKLDWVTFQSQDKRVSYSNICNYDILMGSALIYTLSHMALVDIVR
jgi:hypothetical protein